VSPLPGLIFLAAALAAPGAALAQSVKDFVEVEGARANKIHGYGLVTGLNGSGDSPRDESARVLRLMLQNLVSPDAGVEKIEARNAALVLVTAELPPFQKAGTRLDVAVSAVGDAKSLEGGELQLTDLRGPLGRRDPTVYALASGRLVLQADARRGNPTTASVPGGAIVEKALAHGFVRQDAGTGRRSVKLLLKRPDLTLASQLATQINDAAVVGPGGQERVAEALDGGAILVRIPTAEEVRARTGQPPRVDFEQEPVAWLERVLGLSAAGLAFVAEPACVTISDAAKTVSWTGEVVLRKGSVMIPASAAGARPSVFHASEGQRLSDFMDKVSGALGEQQLVDVVKALHHAGLLQAEVRSR
jgi:flagellar P-ring protein precursor FlgI